MVSSVPVMKPKTNFLSFSEEADLKHSKPDVYTLMRDYVTFTLRSQFCPVSSCRLEELLNLSLNFATHLLKAEEKTDLWATLLVTATAAQGLGFNRAFILEKADTADEFLGQAGLGPMRPEEAAEIWRVLEEEKPGFEEMIAHVKEQLSQSQHPIHHLAQELKISLGEGAPLDKLLLGKNSLILRLNEQPELDYLFERLEVDEIALAVLSIPPQIYGFILVDNFVTKKVISEGDLQFLETIAALTSMAFHRLEVCHQLDHQKHLLVEAERLAAIGQLSSKIFHEIRNPVSVIGGLSKLLIRKNTPGELQPYLQALLKEAQRLEHVLEDLFEFIRPIKLKKRPVRLYRLLQTALSLLHSDFRKANVHVTLEGSSKEPLVLLDQDEMLLVFIHLIKNALEAMPHGGVLKIKIENHQGVRLKIIDSGCGIPSTYLQRVTEPFFTTKTYGSGLGLSVAKKIVELHGGTLALRSLEPSGTEVEIYFPPELITNGVKES